MRRPVAARLVGLGATVALTATLGLAAVSTGAQAATGQATGFASLNGGTTGGAGGQTVTASTGTAIHAALCSRASSSTPITIQVSGTITVGNTAKVSGSSCNTASGVIELKGISNVTIVGVGGATFDQIGIHIRDSSNIVIRDVTVKNVKKSGSPTSNGGDAIGMESTVRNVWVDHVTLEASGGEDEGYDGLFDMKDDVKYVTLSYSILRNSGRGGLIGSSESDRANSFITFHHNLYSNIESRTPLLRGGVAHMYDNHYVGLGKSGINSRAGAQAKVENNYFEDSNDPLGTFYTDEAGTWQVAGNIFDNVTWSSRGTDNNPAGPDVRSTTSVSIPYAYTLDAATCVPALVAATAGANKGLKVSDGSCSPQTPDPTTDPTGGPTSEPTGDPTSNPTSNPTPGGQNLSIGAGADGSSKASGTSYGNVVDGNRSTYWSPGGSTGTVSVKWSSATTISSVVVVEASGATGRLGSWNLVNADTGGVLTSGSGAGVVTFPTTSLKKVSLQVTGSNGVPQIAELETYAGTVTTPDPEPTSDPTSDPEPPGGPQPSAGTLYVSPNGSAGAAGTESAPTTLASAVSRVAPGGEIFLRGGTYRLSETVLITADGKSGDRTLLSAYPGETPVLDFSAQSELSTNRGLSLNADYWHLYGIVVQRAGDNGISIGGSNNVVERVVTRHNRDTGLQISRAASDTPRSDWPANNLVVSSESHDNVDSDGEDADGFAAKLTVGSGNVFRDTVSHHNIDDGWDLYTKSDTGAIGPVTIERSLAYENGTLSDGSQAGAGDRNGFKLGGEDIKVDHVVRNSYAVHNGKHGFTFNSNPGSLTITSNVAVGNAQRNFNFDGGSSVFSGNVSCDSGSKDRVVGTDRGDNAFWSGSNASACSAYDGALAWSFGADGALRVTFGGTSPDPGPTTSPDPGPTSSSPAPPSDGSCTAAVTQVNAWAGGYQATVTVTARDGAIASWRTTHTLSDPTAVQGWNGTFTQSGTALTVSSTPWNGALPPGGTASYGWVGSGAAPSVPTTVGCTTG
ncbi:pectate lyase family protein [Cellulomonas sp. CW35]|uniref:pectate lyase family protein n=1 Tax=Cellulomonas sp. CW35 TaxID=3458249 RepID=UPI0040337DCE